MLFFQTSDRNQHFAEAHGDYLQLAAEGGLLVCGAALLLLVLVVRETRQRFQESAGDPAGYWIRVGAVTGLVAIARQEIRDFSLQMPGNAALCCVLVGIAIQRPRPRRGRRAGVATAAARSYVQMCPNAVPHGFIGRARRRAPKTRGHTSASRGCIGVMNAAGGAGARRRCSPPTCDPRENRSPRLRGQTSEV